MRPSRFDPPRPSPEPIAWRADGDPKENGGRVVETGRIGVMAWVWWWGLVVGAGIAAIVAGWAFHRRRRVVPSPSPLEAAERALARAVALVEPGAIPALFDPRERLSDLERWLSPEIIHEWIEVHEERNRMRFRSDPTIDPARVTGLAARAEALACRVAEARLNAGASDVDAPDRAGI